ncbi:MAG: molecular chaperone DnaJ [Anaerolineae bacterium SG8_19]|jgi:molecular chaperone DnaJ|nr:MAG: molecular chaperone DnaJ [Anaerolineae bacterium SG8_19]
MATKRDYYEVLGVDRSASKEDLKRAYRRMARKFHPDVNKDSGSDERFKEINEAYEVLSNDSTRATYDRFGHAGVQGAGAGFNDFSGFGSVADIFEEFFTGFGTRRRKGPRRGADLRYDLAISFEEAVFGVEKDIQVRRPEICPNCYGSGAEPGTNPVRCTNCNGTGEVRQMRQSFLGSFVNVVTCPVCNGSGETIPSPCTVCNGQKQIQQQRTLNVKIPPGVDNDTQIRLSGEGTPGIDGGPPGNLFVVLHVEKHEYFRRRGDDILLEMEINVAQAALGDEIKVPTVDGEETLIIPAGTQSGTVFPLRGRGVPHLRRSGRGDQLVITHVAVPKKMTPEQKKLMEELARTLGKEVIPQREKSILGQLKDVLGDFLSPTL